MHRLPHYGRIAVLTEGRLGVFTSKTAACLLRYRAADVVALIDSEAAGRDVRAAIPWAPPVPILASVAEALPLRPDALFVGVAPSGGMLPPGMRRPVLDALRAGLDVVSGLHEKLADDSEISAAATERSRRVIDLRTPPGPLPIGAGRARQTRCRRVLTVGTDCNSGKMVTAVELANAARSRGIRAEFVATGQTGIMVCGAGIVIDAVVADFIAGAAEQLLLAHADCDLCVIEGQGSLAHPGFSGVTLGLLHGACPDALILQHHVGRREHRSADGGSTPIPPMAALRDGYERCAALLHPARVVAVALNGFGADLAQVAAERERIERELGLPAVDPLSGGCERLLSAAFGEPC